MALYQVEAEVELVAPVLVSAFEGWVDAATVGTSAATHLAGTGEVVARFDTDALVDYRARRPPIDIVDGSMKSIEWPEIAVRRAHLQRDLLVLTGPEPDYRWRGFAAAVVDLALRLGVVEAVSLGAIPAAVPHTLPTSVLTTTSRRDLIEDGDRMPEGLLRVPGGATSLVELSLSQHGIPVIGFWAQVPHYVAGPYPEAVVALLERLGRHLGIDIPLGGLLDEARAQRARIDEMVAARPEARAYVEQLEQLASRQEDVPSGEEIAAEVERFLRSQGEDPFGEQSGEQA